MKEITYQPIGIIHSPFKEPKGTPIQPSAAKNIHGEVEIFQKYSEGLKDLDGFSHVILLYHFHLSKTSSLTVKPFLDHQSHGVLSTRAPNRPNPIGFSVVQLLNISGCMLHVKDLDIIDGTPLLDIKPYVPEFDKRETNTLGWLTKNIGKLPTTKDDGRFSN
jgi:tRNA-Thr(GGU) m(6)t(6)A37 methyltransferase TsaA